MSHHNADRDLLRGVVADTLAVTGSGVTELDRQRVFTLLLAATAVAAERRFESSDDDAVAGFAAHDEDPGTAAAVIRAALGNPEHLDGIPGNTMTSTMVRVTHAIVADELSTPALVEDFIDEAVELADALTVSA